MPNCVILLWVVWNKNKNKLFLQSGLENTFVVIMKDYFTRPSDL